jgi:MFS family permease
MSVEEPSQLRFMLRALAYRNYRLFFGGQVVSLVGTWLSQVASQWLVLQLALRDHPQSAPLWLGIIGFAGQIPIFLLTPFAGVWVDRVNRHRLLLLTQFLSMLQSFALGGLALHGSITLWQIIALNAFQGLVNAFDIPTRQSLVIDLIENRNDLSNAIALNSSMVHMSRLIGPPIAGFLIYAFGEPWCFVIDGFSYLAVLLALSVMRVPQRPPQALRRVWESLAEGFRYGFGFAPVRAMLVMTAVTSLMMMSQSVLMPIFAKDEFHGDAKTLGWLLGAAGVGAVTGSLYLASRRTVLGLGRVIWMACGALGLAYVTFSFSHALWISLPVLVVCGFSTVVQMASCNTVLQTVVDDDKRGRVMSLFTMAFMGMAPFGSLLAGWLAGSVGAPRTLFCAGLVCLVSSAAFALYLPYLRPLVRPIYRRKGILPEVAGALQSTATQAAASPE